MNSSGTQPNSENSIFLDSASRIGFALCRDAVWDSSACNWMGATVESMDGFARSVYGALSSDVYGGTAGIGLFLSHLANLTGDKTVAKTAIGAIKQATSLQKTANGMSTGFYSGVPGICYAAMMSGSLLGCTEFFDWGLSRLKTDIPKLTKDPIALDVVSGIAGVIPLLLAIQPIWGDSIQLATDLGDYLIKHGTRCERGMSWPMNLNQKNSRNLTGFSHGASGFAWALGELFSHVKLEKYGESAQLAVEYENAWFNQSKGNWPDFRSGTDQQFATAWCHGAPGIGLSRVRLFQIFEKNQYLEDLRTSVQNIAQSFTTSRAQGSYCLCHGHGGNAETLISASRILGNKECESMANEFALTAIRQYQLQGLPFEPGTVGKNPSLMVGDAGVGYWMLRMHTAVVPSILMFDVNANQKTICARDE